jgi:hypothetical protein
MCAGETEDAQISLDLAKEEGMTAGRARRKVGATGPHEEIPSPNSAAFQGPHRRKRANIFQRWGKGVRMN